MPDEKMELTSAEFEQRFFETAKTVVLQIQVLEETYHDLLATIERNGWDQEEGFRILLTLGLGYAQGRLYLEADDEERARLVERLADLESVAAVMKFRTFNFMQDNQTLELRMGALRNAKIGLEAVNDRLRGEIAEYKEKMRLLQAEVDGLRRQLPETGTGIHEPEPSPSWIAKIRSHLGL
ncbi:MAG: hypothetical protein ACUVXG_02650 [Anaerolineae bacterium]